MNKKIHSMLLLCFILANIFSPILSVSADDNIINISTQEELAELAKNCILDSWSVGKTVNLVSDINIKTARFTPIPTFGGRFNGNGYTISGLAFKGSGSDIGLFRYIQKSGRVENLTVKATLSPIGSKSVIGGIAGENNGTIISCSFDGTIKGENSIGCIAGKNTDSGQIISCTSKGSIIGENSTGGIVGENIGLVSNCTNNAEVNTSYEEKKRDIVNADTDVGAIVENLKTTKEENEEESILGHTDTGGIAGHSGGIIQGCTNNADVGYPHIGYNVGGIAGRQSGYMLGCENNGFIRGRKDIGGIVGQAEPYMLLDASSPAFSSVNTELNNLNSMVERFINDTDSTGDDMQTQLNALSKHSAAARDSIEIMSDSARDFAEDNINEINSEAAIISDTIDKLVPVMDSLQSGTDEIGDALDEIRNALDSIDINVPDIEADIDAMDEALLNISNAEKSLGKAISRAKMAINSLKDVISSDNPSATKKALNNLYSAISDIKTNKEQIYAALDSIDQILKMPPSNMDDVIKNYQEIQKHVQTIKNRLSGDITAISTIKTSLDTLRKYTKIDLSSLRDAARQAQRAADYLLDTMYYLRTGLEGVSDTLSNLLDKINDFAQDTNDQLKDAKDKLSKAFKSLSYAADDFSDSLGDLRDIVSDLSKEEPFKLVNISDDFKNASDDLFDSAKDISDDIESLKSVVSDGRTKLSNHLRSISKQFNLVINLLFGEIEDFQNFDDSLGDVFVDTSDDNIISTKQGKVSGCVNHAEIEGDRNTGGIAGSMSIEYSKDPEDDIEKPKSINFTYRTKTILYQCINDGEITGKKDCTGGVAGLAELGTIYECENYDSVKSTNGNYVGGIAGKSDSAIRRSFSKSDVEGKRYVGGIAGKAKTLSASYAISAPSGDENVGSVAGTVSGFNAIADNYYIQNDIGAIDSVSYSGKAEAITYDTLTARQNIPKRFAGFTVTFIADDEIVDTQTIKYGESTDRIKMPTPPSKDDEFGVWPEIKEKTVTKDFKIECEYKPYITVLSSEEKNDNGKLALCLAEGKFTDDATLNFEENSLQKPKHEIGHLKTYSVKLENTDISADDEVTLHVLNESRKKVSAWQMTDGGWEKVSTKTRGKYVLLKTTGAESEICLKYDKISFNPLWLLPIVAVILAAAIIFRKKIRLKKNKKVR